jgi:hypothetical protein
LKTLIAAGMSSFCRSVSCMRGGRVVVSCSAALPYSVCVKQTGQEGQRRGVDSATVDSVLKALPSGIHLQTDYLH